ncbi:MAG: PhoX family phosphatase [Chloroflexaceae bacterium]|nr:PhoX family phosphatase [Chloroflexaceae bacterium]
MGGRDEVDKWVVRSEAGKGETFGEIAERSLSRRAFLKSASLTSMAVVAALAVGTEPAAAQRAPLGLRFQPIAPTAPDVDDLVVPDGYFARTLIRWGEPLAADVPAHNVWAQTPALQARQFGYNCDFVGFLPLPLGSTNSNRGLLAVNHEYTNEELMFPGYDAKNPTRNQVDVGIEAHGVSVVEIQRAPDGNWSYVRDSPYNRRLTGTTPMRISGPAASHPWMKTVADPAGATVLGTLNNCAGGKTPWGTILTAEENFHQYFGNLQGLDADDPRYAAHRRYGMPAEQSERGWELYHDRFDVAKDPNEGFRFGWMVEFDPYDPNMVPVKRTTMGRFRHEAATIALAPSGQVVAYTGDDAQFEYVYKFVTRGRFNASNRQANMNMLDEGTLYVARFNDDGTGQWLPLVFGQGPLTPANGFADQADVLVKTRQAADAVGATKMDRPEDIETNPVNRKVYIVLTNNTRRGAEGQAGPDKANPRANNATGHIIELTETGNNHAATTFRWEIFLLAGRPEDPSTYFAGYDKSKVSPIGAPDNITFDLSGNMWIATDGAPRAIKLNDGFFAVPVAGTERGHVQQFFSSVAGSEVCGPEFTPDNRSLFLAIQHPGEGGTFEEPISTWPDRVGLPRPSVVYIGAWDSRPIGR